MRMISLTICAAAIAVGGPVAQGGEIRGDYLEARTADVFTGPCFSNAEIFSTGRNAVMAWKVTSGSWKGVELGGLCIAAAVNATETFSQDQPENATAVMIVDSRADSRQRDALIDLARSMGGARLRNIRGVTTTRMSLKLETEHGTDLAISHATHGMPQTPRASFWAAGLAQIVTRPLDERDHACGNEVTAYAPLSRGVTARPAYTLDHTFKGQGLGTAWADPNCRSSFVGHFAI